jgi:hypothetical protein
LIVKILCLIFGLFLSSTICIGAEARTFDVSWQAQGNPGFVKIDGAGGKASCTVNTVPPYTGTTCDCALDAFDTGIEKRNQHMREKYLETGKWPKATLKVMSVADGKFSGFLTLKGKEKPVSGTAVISKDGQLEASFSISLDDYGVGVPSWLGVTVAKDVTVTVKGSAK